MTPEQRIAAIRTDLTERNMEYPLGARDAWWLLRYAEALRAVAEAATWMPEPVGPYGACVVCGVMPPHRDKCPYGLLQSALQRWKGVVG